MVRTTLREAFAAERPLVTPLAHDALSARLIARAGFRAFAIGGSAMLAARNGLPDPPLDKSMAFENSTLTYQGAVDGLGVAIAQVAFVIDEIERGRLVAPVDVRLKSEMAYFLVFPREKAQLRKLRLFNEWAATEAATTRAAMS